MSLLDDRWRRQLRVLGRFATRTPPWPGFGEPFNGQRVRLRAIREIVARFEPDAFIETGTFLGHTTRFFSGNGVPVYTVEVKPSIYAAARLRLAWDPSIHLRLGDSSEVVRELTTTRAFFRPFAYLDAHWWDELPLPGEVSDILAAWPDAVIAIDDFEVPGDPAYGFDRFRDEPLSLDMLQLPPGALAAYPGIAASQETGGRRGTLYIAQGDDAREVFRSLIEKGEFVAAPSPPE